MAITHSHFCSLKPNQKHIPSEISKTIPPNLDQNYVPSRYNNGYEEGYKIY